MQFLMGKKSVKLRKALFVYSFFFLFSPTFVFFSRTFLFRISANFCLNMLCWYWIFKSNILVFKPFNLLFMAYFSYAKYKFSAPNTFHSLFSMGKKSFKLRNTIC